MKLITHENAPRWYALSCDRGNPSITISVHRDLAKTIKPVSKTAPVVKAFIATFKFKGFEGSLEKNFGFDEVIARSEEEEFVKFKAKLPTVFRLLDDTCEECGGTGRDEDRDDKCLWCWGKGRKHSYEWDRAFAVSASFNLLLDLIAYPNTETSSKFPQLLTVQLITDKGQHGGSLGGMYSKPLVKWLSVKKPRYQILEMEWAMRAVYEAMLPNKDVVVPQPFRASVDYKGGWLNVDCPGDACGLHPASGHLGMREENGYEFQCHNVDTPAQQLTLLAGLATLHEAVDKELPK